MLIKKRKSDKQRRKKRVDARHGKEPKRLAKQRNTYVIVVLQKVLEITSGRVFFNEKKRKRIEINSFVRLNELIPIVA